MFTRLASVLVCAVLVACAKSSPSTESAAAPRPAASSRDVIARAEIEQNAGISNAFDLIQRLRPNFLRVQGRTSIGAVAQGPLIRVDGQELGDASMLRSLETALIQEIRFYSVVDAESKFGGARGQPVIAITTKKLRG